MSQHIIDLMLSEKAKLDRAIEILQGTENAPAWVYGKKEPVESGLDAPTLKVLAMPNKKRAPMSAAGKANIIAALKKRHDDKKAAKEAMFARLAKARATNKKKAA